VRRFVRDNSLSLFFGAIFLLALLGQAVSGLHEVNNQQLAQGGEPISMGRYLTSSYFAVDVTENWQSEYLQFLLYITATVYLVQRGSPESKPVDEVGPESDEDQKVGRFADEDSPEPARTGGFRTARYGHSLGLVMGGIFALSWLVQSIAGRVAYNVQRLADREDPVSWFGYVTGADFWNRTLQNWQSEFLAVASMVVFSIYLRQRGSPESKPVGAPHSATGVQG